MSSFLSDSLYAFAIVVVECVQELGVERREGSVEKTIGTRQFESGDVGRQTSRVRDQGDASDG